MKMKQAPAQGRFTPACARLWTCPFESEHSRVDYTFPMLNETLEHGQHLVDRTLESLLPRPEEPPESIHRAMRHSVFAGGKRLRPILCLEGARMIAGYLPEGVEELGGALEMLHTYSLIH